jgi:hypothetical protein
MQRLSEGVEQLKGRVVAKRLKVPVVMWRWKGPEAMLPWARDTLFCPLPRNQLLSAIELTTWMTAAFIICRATMMPRFSVSFLPRND